MVYGCRLAVVKTGPLRYNYSADEKLEECALKSFYHPCTYHRSANHSVGVLEINSMFQPKLLKFSLLLLTLGLLLSACAEPVTAPGPTLKPPATETLTLPGLTPTDAPTVIVSPLPSRTPAPPKPSKTPDFQATEIAQFPVQCANYSVSDEAASFSPDKNWLVAACNYNHEQVLEVVSRSGQHWVLQFKDFILPEYVSDNRANTDGNLFPVYWSGDGGFLYFAAYVACDEGGPCFFGYGVHGLFRINLKDGKVSTILSAVSVVDAYHFTFSSTGRRLAYQKDVSNPISLDLKTGQETSIPVGKNEYAGGLVWSENGLQLAYATCQVNRTTYAEEKSAVKIYSIPENTSKTILEAGKSFLVAKTWEKNILKVYKRDEKYQESYLFFDVSTGQWLTSTPEP
jgi:hypothetical protein